MTTNKGPRIFCVVLALGCGGKVETQASSESTTSSAGGADQLESGASGLSGSVGTAIVAGVAGGASARIVAGSRGTPPPSCVGLAATCGPNGDADCCVSSVVAGGTFNRGNDAQAPATVSDFRLDNYEITVGRFRRFWNEYPQTLPVAGSGTNPNNPSDSGWNALWNTDSLSASQADLTSKISCDATQQTWTANNEAFPMNCVDWFEAEAFCIWDGGRLPTEAEWNYAASGGAAQRQYPWGSADPDCTYANFFGAADGNDFCVAPGIGGVNRVGSESPKGDGLYGQADLAGNVWEWVQDTYDSYVVPCSNCANSAAPASRVMRGGAFSYDYGASSLLSFVRSGPHPSDRSYFIGARCARPL